MEKKIYESVSFLGLRCGSKNWRCGATPDAEALKESGRSILEVLAALTVMSVISFGGIKGYETLSRKMKINTMSNDIAALVKERQIQAMDKMQNQANVQDKKIGNIPVRIQNGTSQDGDKEPFFWIDIDLEHKEECEEFLYTDAVTPAFITINDSIPGECPGKVRLYFPKDPNDETSGIKTYVNPVDGKTYVCQGDECVQSGNNSHGLACRKGYTANSTKTSCEKIACASGTGFAGDAYRGDFVDYANDGVTRCYCPTDFVLADGNCVRSGAGQCSNHGVYQGGSCTCDDGYYGADCSGYNDCSGHGRVDSNGSCTCDDGYYGSYCENEETSDPCNGRGSWCGNACACSNAWTGTYCETPVVCSEHTVGPWSETRGCTCESCWSGKDCSVLCGAGCLCNYHGEWKECGSYCICDTGYYGAYCAYETSDPCNGHGTLNWIGGHYWQEYEQCGGSCLCDKGYASARGQRCDDFNDNHCNGHGQSIYGYTPSAYGQSATCGCLCDKGWYIGCSYKDPNISVCSDKGRSLSFGDFVGCLCDDGTLQEGDPINGNLCSTGAYNACSGHGTLDWAGANYWPGYSNSCLCDKGYYGADCSQSRSACYNHGQYSVAGCVCDSGYYGTECYTCGNLCNGNGQYIAFGFDDRNGACLCNDGTIQEGYNACATSGEYDLCNGHGTWDGSYCACNTGYYGANCENEGRDPCNGHGTLNWPGANHWPSYLGSCLCEAGYARDPLGAQCAANTLSSRTYGQGFGMMEGGYLCHAGYYGASCENRGNSVCSNNGQYIAINGRGVACLCNDGTIEDGDPINGNLCSTTGAYEACSGHGTWDDDLGYCACDAGYYGANCEDDEDSRCNGHGTWDDDLGYCVCEAGYYGAYCQGEEPSDAELCHGHGTLNWTGANYFSSYPNLCLCDEGYEGFNYGTQCLYKWASGNYKKYGQSLGLGTVHGAYLCYSGYCGEACLTQNSSVCNGNGRHLRIGNFTGCLCNNGTIQEGNASCTSSPCSGHGTMTNGVCVCESGWGGDFCEVAHYESICSGHGTLDWPGAHEWEQYEENGGRCLCDRGYTDSYCGGVFQQQCALQEERCNNHGKFQGCGCLCDMGRWGWTCEWNVDHCSNSGRYIETPDGQGCLCNDNTIQYFSDTDYPCANSENKCNSNGTWDGNSCTCNEGWYGASCDIDCDGFKDNSGTCYPCSTLDGVGNTSSSECMKCNSTSYPRTAYTTSCGGNFECSSDSCTCSLTSDGCKATGGFRPYSHDLCMPCSYPETVKGVKNGACSGCNGTPYRREERISSGIRYCSLTSAGCDALYSEGGLKDYAGNCYSCSSPEGVSSLSLAECHKCNNRFMDYAYGTAAHTCYLCSFSDAVWTGTDECSRCSNTSTPRFLSSDEKCYLCSYDSGVSTSQAECGKCSNRVMDGNWCVLSTATCNALYPTTGCFRNNNGKSYSCSYSSGISTTKDECDQCTTSSTPRFMSNSGYCYSCSFSNNISASKDECDQCGSQRTYDTSTGKCKKA